MEYLKRLIAGLSNDYAMAPPKVRYGLRLESESLQNFERYYMSVAVFAGKRDPSAEVLQIRLSGVRNQKWEDIARIHLYRDQQGYSQMPTTPVQSSQRQDTEEASREEFDDMLSEESKKGPFL